MGSRRLSREQALQVLYQVDMTEVSVDDALRIFWESEPADPDVVEFTGTLVRGVNDNRERIDQLISDASTNWKVPRMSFVDRNIMRVALYEFLELSDIPPMVSVNEAIELGKRFGSTESGSFINGILDRVARNLSLTEGVGT